MSKSFIQEHVNRIVSSSIRAKEKEAKEHELLSVKRGGIAKEREALMTEAANLEQEILIVNENFSELLTTSNENKI